MKGINLFLYSLKQGLVNLRKNRMFTLASVGTVAACLFVFGLFYFVLGNFRHIVHSAEHSVGVSVFFDEAITEQCIQMIGDAIRTREEVDKIIFVSAEEAWRRFKEENFADSPDLIESFGDDNPLADSASYEIYLKDIAKQDILVEYLKTVAGIRDIKKSDEVAGGLSNFNQLVGVITIVLITVLLLVSVFLILLLLPVSLSGVRKLPLCVLWGPRISLSGRRLLSRELSSVWWEPYSRSLFCLSRMDD